MHVAWVVEVLLAVCMVILGYGICWVSAVRPLRRQQGRIAAAPKTGKRGSGQRTSRYSGRQAEGRRPGPGEPIRPQTPAGPAAMESSSVATPPGPGTEKDGIYAERLEFSAVRAGSGAAAEPRFRVAVHRELAPYPVPPSNPDVIERSAREDPDFRDRLTDTAADYLAGKYGDPVVARVTSPVFVTNQSFPETDLAEACSRISDTLTALVERPLAAAGAQLRIPAPVDAAGAGIGAGLILEPFTTPLGNAARLFEIAGVGVGLLTGLHPLVLASAKLLARGELHRQMTQGILEAGRSLARGEPLSRAEPGDRPPAAEARERADARADRPPDRPPGVPGPEQLKVPSAWNGERFAGEGGRNGTPGRPGAHLQERGAVGEDERWVDSSQRHAGDQDGMRVHPMSYRDERAAASEVEYYEPYRSRTLDPERPARGGPRERDNGSYGEGASERG